MAWACGETAVNSGMSLELPGLWTRGSFKSAKTAIAVSPVGLDVTPPLRPRPPLELYSVKGGHVLSGCLVHVQLGSQKEQPSWEQWLVGAEFQRPQSCSTRQEKVLLQPTVWLCTRKPQIPTCPASSSKQASPKKLSCGTRAPHRAQASGRHHYSSKRGSCRDRLPSGQRGSWGVTAPGRPLLPLTPARAPGQD